MTIHKISIKPKEYLPLIKGEKTFEIAKEQNFLKGDKIVFEEWEPGRGATGRRSTRHISYVLAHLNCPHAIKEGYCVLGFDLF